MKTQSSKIMRIILLLCVAGIACHGGEMKPPPKAEVEAFLANWDANMKRIGTALEPYQQIANTGTVQDITVVLAAEAKQPAKNIQWKSLPHVVPSEVKALRKGWCVSYARTFMADNAMYVKDEALYISHEGRRILFHGLMKRDPGAALQWLSGAKDSQEPTLFDAIMCGEVYLQERNEALFDSKNESTWRAMLTAKNPALVALALQVHREKEVHEEDLSEAITSALGSEWLSLQDAAIEASRKLKPERTRSILSRYMKENEASGERHENLRKKAQDILTRLPSAN